MALSSAVRFRRLSILPASMRVRPPCGHRAASRHHSSFPCLDWAGHSLCRRSQSHKNPGKESVRARGREREREAHCPSAVRGGNERPHDRHCDAAGGDSAWPATAAATDAWTGSSFCPASYIQLPRPRGIPGGFPLHSNARASVRCVGSFQRNQRWAKLILANLDSCFLPRQLATRDRQIHLWRHGVGTETLCGSPSLPPSYRAGWKGVGRSIGQNV